MQRSGLGGLLLGLMVSGVEGAVFGSRVLGHF